MPEDNTEETALQTTDAPIESHQYMPLGYGDSITVLDDFAQIQVDAFKKERHELDALEDDAPVNNSPAKVETAVSELAEKLGGIAAVEALSNVLSNPNSNLTEILPAEAVENLVWTALDNPAIQATVLADPAVLAAISNQLFFGHSVQNIQALLAQYQRGDGVSEQQLEAQAIAAETRVQNFQHDFFVSPVDQVVNSFGIDADNRTEEIQDALRLAQSKFLTANYGEFIALQSAAELGQVSAVSSARLQNKWSAYLLKEIGKLSGKSPVKAKPKSMNADVKDEEQPAKLIDAGIGNNGDWLIDFEKDFKAERIKRGLLTPRERKAAN